MHPVRIWSPRPGSSRQRGVRDVGSREQVLRCYTQLQWTSACWHPAHFTVQYLSEPTCRCPASCSPATDPQIAHFQPSASPPHFAHSRFTVCPILTPLARAPEVRYAAGDRPPTSASSTFRRVRSLVHRREVPRPQV